MQNLELFRQATSEVMAEETEEEEERVSTVKVIDTETDEVTLGIDVSEYQGNIDWSQAAEGQDFVMVRVGYRSSETGEITEDACARYNLQEAERRDSIWEPISFPQQFRKRRQEKRPAGSAIFWTVIPSPIRWPITARAFRIRTAASIS